MKNDTSEKFLLSKSLIIIILLVAAISVNSFAQKKKIKFKNLLGASQTLLGTTPKLKGWFDNENYLKAKNDPRSGLRDKIVDAMTTNETLWFRDTYPFDVMKSTLLPEYYAEIKDRCL